MKKLYYTRVLLSNLILFLLIGSEAWINHQSGLPQSSHPGRCWVAPQQLGSFETLGIPNQNQELSTRRILLDKWIGDPIDFKTGWDIQKDYLQQHIHRLGQSTGETVIAPLHNGFMSDLAYGGFDRVIMLEHKPVYTLGTGSDPSFVLDQRNAIPIVRMDRGGEVTYHGPGQLTVYPILDLRNYRQDIHWYVRALEETILVALRICWENHGGSAEVYREPDFTGVWVRGHGKVAAIGVKCRRWITQHGLAINVESASVPPFAGIVPCGLSGSKAVVTCVNDLVERPVSITEMANYVKAGIEEVFCVKLEESKMKPRILQLPGKEE